MAQSAISNDSADQRLQREKQLDNFIGDLRRLGEVQNLYSAPVECVYPGVEMARDVGFEEIWNLFLESNFLYPEKVARLQPVVNEIEQTMRRLLRANGDLIATAVLRERGRVEAHYSKLRWHENTWMVQHLAAMPLSSRESDATARVTLALTYYGRLRGDIEWVKGYYRPNNPWPARVLGGFARSVRGSATSDHRVFHYLVAETGEHVRQGDGEVKVRPADERDLAMIEDWYQARGRLVELEANDLRQSRCDAVSNISRDYARFGILRKREVIVAERHGRAAGFALLEIASLGLNFSELTNAFTVHLLEDDRCAQAGLVRAAKQRYGQMGRTHCVALEEGEQLGAFESAGFKRMKDYACWTFHRTHLEAMEEYFVNLFGSRRRGRN